jgi:membrane peptidoglycan carboxypeptidase
MKIDNRYARITVTAAVVLSFLILALNLGMQTVGALGAEEIDLSAPAIDPPVVTYGPPVQSVGQSVGAKAVIQQLVAAGLSESPNGRPVGPGNYAWNSPVLTFRPDFPGQPGFVKIVFNGNNIESIFSDDVAASNVELPPKPITSLSYQFAETGSEGLVLKRVPVSRIPVRNGELNGSTIQLTLCSSEGGCGVAVDLSGIVRSAWNDVRRWFTADNTVRQGGSGICAQMLKNISGDFTPTLTRKAREFAICNDLVRRVPPERMFEVWANWIYLGESKTGKRLLGVETGAEELFGVKARNLDLKQSVFLASLVSEPRLLRKLWQKNPDPAAIQRFNAKRKTIAETIARKNPNRFAQAEIDAAKTWHARFAWDQTPRDANVDRTVVPILQLAAVENPILKEKQDPDTLPINVTELNQRAVMVTGFVEGLQSAAGQILNRNLPAIQKRFPPIDGRTQKRSSDSLIGVVAAIDNRTGELVTMGIAATDPKVEIGALYANGKLFPASQSKPAAFTCALDKKVITATTRIDPSKAAIKRLDGSIWIPTMGIGNHIRASTEAQAASDDGATVVVTNALGIEQAMKCWEAFSGNAAKPNVSTTGQKEYPPVCSIGFCAGMETSPLQLLAGYSALARSGSAIRPRALRSVWMAGKKTDLQINTIERPVFSPESAFIENWALRNVVGVGPWGNFGTAAGIGFANYAQKHPEMQLACKTGSGAAALGITCLTPRVTITVQVFFQKNSFFKQSGGYALAANTAGPIMSDYLWEVLRTRPDLLGGSIEVPAGIQFVRTDIVNNCRDDVNGVNVPFIRGTEPDPCVHDAMVGE